MRIITAFAVLVIILPVHADAAETYSFSLSPSFGFIHGFAEELVYAPNDTFVSPIHSLLLWEINSIFYYGLKLDLSRTDPMEKWGYIASLTLKYGIPGASGKLEDSDWLSVENADLTHYSEHDNFLNEYYLLNFYAGFSFPLKNKFLLKTYLEASYFRLRFSSFGGFTMYSREKGKNTYYPISQAPINKIPDGEKVINYLQDWLVFSPCASLRLYFLKYFHTDFSFKISPLIFCADLDEHLLLNDQYRDYMRFGIYLEPALQLSFIPVKWLDISADCSWQYITNTRGETYKRRPIGTGIYGLTGNAGAGLSMIDFTLYLKIRL
jgi:outer membrane protease